MGNSLIFAGERWEKAISKVYTGAGEGIMAKVFAAYTWNLNFLKHSTDTSKE